MKKILFPTDFSKNATNAFNYAVKVAEQLNAKLDIIHIYSIAFNDVTALPPDYVERLMSDKKREVRTQLEQFTAMIDVERKGMHKAIYGIFPATEIVDYADKENYDYIIMGTKGAHNPLDRIMGTISSSVILKASCPVMVVPEFAEFKGIDTIAYAISFEVENEPTIQQLETFSKGFDATIHFVHVDPRAPKGKPESIMKNPDSTATATRFALVHHPSITLGLETYAIENEVNLLALHIPHRRLWERIFHQSVTKKMALHTSIPLLVFHE